jgi:hypothetical protein
MRRCEREKLRGPTHRRNALHIAQFFREHFLPDLPGADQTEKLNAVFAKAREWLLWFNHAEVIGGDPVWRFWTFQASLDMPVPSWKDR